MLEQDVVRLTLDVALGTERQSPARNEELSPFISGRPHPCQSVIVDGLKSRAAKISQAKTGGEIG